MIEEIMTGYYNDLEVLLMSVDHNVSRLINDRSIIDKLPLLIDDYMFNDQSMISLVVGEDNHAVSTHMNVIDLCRELLDRYDLRTADSAFFEFIKTKYAKFFGDKQKLTRGNLYFPIKHFLIYFNLSKIIGEIKVCVGDEEFTTSKGLMYYVNKYKHKSNFELTQMLYAFYNCVLDFIYKKEVKDEHNV